ncbi:GMC family oxidoreductase [Rhizobium calliandrae]|uniref:GMC family oxidoreductase n=1 Tax=Rhizobium calliandrae TaxID=1312182 RepID=A0ABT7KFT1_9HYPH|nr:GMC family oxidoreductase [Rhizobium calliandrae]MDL2406039.1 GMC family oxidoreductase [Rhizobium calliandrae]
MVFRDLRSAPDNALLDADIAIVGGGPAGITIARELANTPFSVLVIDSGGLDYEAEVQTLNAVENVGEPVARAGIEPVGRGYSGSQEWLNEIPAFELRNRLLGGSSYTWVGKCAAFDEIDFARRPWLSLSGWPIGRDNLQTALDKAGDLLNLGPNLYDEHLYERLHSRPTDLGLNSDLVRPFFWQFSHERDQHGEPMRFNRRAREINATNIDFLTHATVMEVVLDHNGRRATSLNVMSLEGNKAVINARTIVLCGGGIENARLLLASNALMKSGIGNSRDVVGRYLADHPRTALAHVTGRDIARIARHFNFYGLSHKGRTHFYLQGLSLGPDMQMREGLTNCAAYPVQIHAADDPWAALKRVARGSHRTLARDLSAIGRSPGMIASGLYNRLIRKRGLPHRSTELRFDVMAEQELDPESRVTLSHQRDRFGRPVPRVDWKIGSCEIKSIKRLAQVISKEFGRIGLPRPQLAHWIAMDDDSGASFTDMAHPSCTTRMGTDRATSVVDPNAMVHGIDGLFVAGSSVFPTSGHANPTLMVLTLAIRLADHLKARHAIDRGRVASGRLSQAVVKTA